MSVLLMAATLFATEPLRDPFWPVGYEGKRWPISMAARFRAGGVATNAVNAAAEAEAVKVAENGLRRQEAETERLEREEAERARRIEEERKAQEREARWTEALKALRFGGAIRSSAEDGERSKAAVIVNGRVRSEGDVVRADSGGYRFAWRIVRSGEGRKLRLERLKMESLEKIKERKKR